MGLVSVTPVKPMHPSQFTAMENLLLISFLGEYGFEPQEARRHLPVGAEDGTGGRQEKSVRDGRGDDIFPIAFGHVGALQES